MEVDLGVYFARGVAAVSRELVGIGSETGDRDAVFRLFFF